MIDYILVETNLFFIVSGIILIILLLLLSIVFFVDLIKQRKIYSTALEKYSANIQKKVESDFLDNGKDKREDSS